MQCPNCGAVVTEDLLICGNCAAPIGVAVRTSGGQDYGPYSLQSVRQYVAEGRINPHDSHARIGAGPWAPLHDILILCGAYPVGPSPGAGAVPPAPDPEADRRREWWARQVPYRNAPALASYYLGVFSFVPCVGPLLGLVAIPLAIVGLRRVKAHPEIHGAQHAWTGIVLAGLSIIGHVILVIVMTRS